MKSLITDMVQEDPKKRPAMDEVVNRFVEIKNRLSTWKLPPGWLGTMRSGLSPRGDRLATGIGL